MRLARMIRGFARIPCTHPYPMKTSLLLLLGLTALTARAADSVIVFNELHYHPGPGQQEYIELRNLQGVDVNVAGWKITGI